VQRKMGKRKITNEGNLERMVIPSSNDVLGVAVKMLGAERIMVKCQDGKERLCRVHLGIFRKKPEATYSGVTVKTSQIGLETTIISQCKQRGKKNNLKMFRMRKYFQNK